MVIILGDSHARGCASEVKKVFNETFEVTGYVKPGSGSKIVTETASVEVQKLSKKDVVIVWGGTNDISRNNSSQGLRHLSDFVQNLSNTNVVLMCAPHRHDLSETALVNTEVKVFNRKLKKIMKGFENSRVIDINMDRNLFTQHGLHMNASGKTEIAKVIVGAVEDILQHRQHSSIKLKWKEDSIPTETVSSSLPETVPVRSSSRKAVPPSKFDSFLCQRMHCK